MEVWAFVANGRVPGLQKNTVPVINGTTGSLPKKSECIFLTVDLFSQDIRSIGYFHLSILRNFNDVSLGGFRLSAAEITKGQVIAIDGKTLRRSYDKKINNHDTS